MIIIIAMSINVMITATIAMAPVDEARRGFPVRTSRSSPARALGAASQRQRPSQRPARGMANARDPSQAELGYREFGKSLMMPDGLGMESGFARSPCSATAAHRMAHPS